MDRTVFFDRVRKSPFGGSLSPGQVSGLTLILDEAERRSITDHRWTAYILATAFHETGALMQPIKEKGGAAYLTKMYDPASTDPKRAAMARKNGNTTPGDGVRYAGRGLVQITWLNNYRKMGKVVGRDLVKNPDEALEPAIAVKILFHGMIAGSFTGKKLSDFFQPTSTDWRNARRIVNGVDRADLIAGHARKFHDALEAAGKPLQRQPDDPGPSPAPKAEQPPAGKPASNVAAPAAGVSVIFGALALAGGANWTTVAAVVGGALLIGGAAFVAYRIWKNRQ